MQQKPFLGNSRLQRAGRAFRCEEKFPLPQLGNVRGCIAALRRGERSDYDGWQTGGTVGLAAGAKKGGNGTGRNVLRRGERSDYDGWQTGGTVGLAAGLVWQACGKCL